ncbi:MAG: hypothetical protein JHC52_00640, partial [Chthoniobacterales bacterium]|nr:hypothetical protein [Chthoniobacterales bacterium]
MSSHRAGHGQGAGGSCPVAKSGRADRGRPRRRRGLHTGVSANGTIEVPISIPGSPCRILVGRGLLATAGQNCADHGWGASCALI